MQQCHPALRPELAQRGLQFQGFIERLAYELFDQPFTPGSQRPPAETAGESLDSRKADSQYLMRLPIEDVNAGITQNFGDFPFLA